MKIQQQLEKAKILGLAFSSPSKPMSCSKYDPGQETLHKLLETHLKILFLFRLISLTGSCP